MGVESDAEANALETAIADTVRNHRDSVRTVPYNAKIKSVRSDNASRKDSVKFMTEKSLKICCVAKGAVDIYPRLGTTMERDTATEHAGVLFAGKSIEEETANLALEYIKIKVCWITIPSTL